MFYYEFREVLKKTFLQSTSGRLVLQLFRDIKIEFINVEYYFKINDSKGLDFETTIRSTLCNIVENVNRSIFNFGGKNSASV